MSAPAATTFTLSSGWALLAIVMMGCGTRPRSETPIGAAADSTFGQPECLTIRGYAGDAMEPFITRDGRYLLYNSSNAPGAQTDLHIARLGRGLTAEYVGPLHGANSPVLDGVPTVTADGTLYFVSVRSYGTTESTVYSARLHDAEVTDVRLVDGLPRERGVVIFDVETGADDATLIYSRGIFTGGPIPKRADLRIARRSNGRFLESPELTALLESINTEHALEYAAAISTDGREIFFTRFEERDAPPSIYRATRTARETPFGPAAALAATGGFVEAPALSPDEKLLYYHQKRGDRFQICRVRRLR